MKLTCEGEASHITPHVGKYIIRVLAFESQALRVLIQNCTDTKAEVDALF